MSVKEFVSDGYLQEVNRRFFHPLGLALAVTIDRDFENETLDEALDRADKYVIDILDWRDDPEGVMFEDLEEFEILRGEKIQEKLDANLAYREEHLGFGIQPLRSLKNV